MNQVEFKVIFRSPEYPTIVISADRLYSAFDIEELAESCISSTPTEGRQIVQVIDSKGEEFWYSPENYAISPGFSFKKWMKKRIIEKYNNSLNSKMTLQQYSMKSLSSKRLSKIVREICEMLRSP